MKVIGIITKLLTLAIGTIISLLALSVGSTFAGDNRIDVIKERGEILVCVSEFPTHWSGKDPETGEWAGIAIEAAKNLALVIGVDYKLIGSNWRTRISFLETGKCDITMDPVYPTEEYAMRVLFSDPVRYVSQGMAVHMDSPAQTHKDLDQEGMIIVVGPSSADERLADRLLKKATVKLLPTDEHKYSDYFSEVASRRADALLYHTPSLKKFIKENPDMNLRVIDEALNPQGFAFAVPLGEYHFLSVINVWFKNIQHTGADYYWRQKFTPE